TSKLNVNLGVRWQFMTNPTERLNRLYAIADFAHGTGFVNVPNVFQENPTWHNIDPRIGIAYDPFANHKTSIRAGFGLFHDPITVQSYQTGFGSAPPWAASTIQNAIYPVAPTNATAAALLPAQTLPWYWPNHQTPYMIQYNFNIQRELAANTVLMVGYVGSHGVHLVTSIEANPPIPVITPDGVYHFTNAAGVTNARVN